MDYLVCCPCGHPLSDHGEKGCLHAGCGCPKNPGNALAAAIDEAKTAARASLSPSRERPPNR